MRPQSELDLTAHKLGRAALRGPDPAQTARRLEALELLAGEVVRRVERALPALAELGPGLAACAARHLLESGGKRIRPLLLVLAARAAGGLAHACAAEEALAQAAELVHAATLLHDDVLDDGTVRRGVPAARVLWGNAASVLGGDFLLVRALELAAAAQVPAALDELLTAIGRMIDGEALQLQHRGHADLDPAAYLRVIDGKTAALFAWCGRAGARLAGGQQLALDALGEYGLHLGRAFQIVDDVLDLEGAPEALGKCVLSDLREGKLTLPVLYALQETPALRRRLVDAADELDAEAARRLTFEVAARVRATGAHLRARADAVAETRQAIGSLAPLPPNLHTQALGQIAEELCARVS